MWLVKEGQVPRPMAARVAEAEANGVGSVETGAPATAAAVGQVHSMRCHVASERGGGWDSVHFVWICGAVGCQSAMRASKTSQRLSPVTCDLESTMHVRQRAR